MFETKIELKELSEKVDQIRTEIRKVIIGQDKMLNLLIAAMLADGHVLIEGVPGLAKTLTAKLMARSFSVDFSRIQFTPDLMPSDVIGTSIFNSKTAEFEFRKGPVFTNILLVDEINRAPAKTQSALFEVMEERQVTADGQTHKMKPPFLVVATQNPVEQEGTYRLPEAQLDRFLFKIEVRYPTLEEEVSILELHHSPQDSFSLEQIKPVLTGEQVAALQAQVNQIRIEKHLMQYIAEVVQHTRNHPAFYLGASPRASIAIMRGAKAFAAMDGRDFVVPEDIKEVIPSVLQHRVILSADKEIEGVRPQQVIEQILATIEIPR